LDWILGRTLKKAALIALILGVLTVIVLIVLNYVLPIALCGGVVVFGLLMVAWVLQKSFTWVVGFLAEIVKKLFIIGVAAISITLIGMLFWELVLTRNHDQNPSNEQAATSTAVTEPTANTTPAETATIQVVEETEEFATPGQVESSTEQVSTVHVSTPTEVAQATEASVTMVADGASTPQVPLPAVDAGWQVYSAETNEPINGAIAVLVFSETVPPLVTESDSNGVIHLLIENDPKMGANHVGIVRISHEGYAPTVINFRFDSAKRELIPMLASGVDISSGIPLYTNPDLPRYIEESRVVSECITLECAEEIARSSGYINPSAGIRCEEFQLENPHGTDRLVRSDNGFSLVFTSGSFGPTSDVLPTWKCDVTDQTEPLFILQDGGNLVWPRV